MLQTIKWMIDHVFSNRFLDNLINVSAPLFDKDKTADLLETDTECKRRPLLMIDPTCSPFRSSFFDRSQMCRNVWKVISKPLSMRLGRRSLYNFD